MSRSRSGVLLLQVLTGACAVGMGWLAGMPWLDDLSLLVLLGATLGAELAPPPRLARVSRWLLLTACAGTGVMLGSLALTNREVNWWDGYYAVLFWLVAAFLQLACSQIAGRPRTTGWRILVFVWAISGGFIWLAASYLGNQAAAFHWGLLIEILLLIQVRRSFQLPPAGILTAHAIILLLVTLPLTNLAVKPPARAGARAATARDFTRATAAKDPARFARWWDEYLEQLGLLGKDIFVPDPEGVLPFRLKPNGQGRFFQSHISINSRGLRGREIPSEKGAAYRVVVLGESTTFGFTVKPGDRPWPEVLEEIIQERMRPERPVEVINAGVPAYHLRQNVHRFARDILPLKPDLIISYHGYNGFKLLAGSYSRSQGKPPPNYKARPSRLLAKVEYRVKRLRHRWREEAAALADAPVVGNPMKTDYALAYEQLIKMTQTHGIALALADFSMAVNHRSNPDTVDFYRPGFPLVRWEITANVVHTLIVKTLARQHSEVRFVDTHPNLDGRDEKFIDLVHLTQDGRQQLAENVFAGINSLLKPAVPARPN